MTADLHDQLNRCAGQKFIGTKGAAGSMRSDPVVFGFYDFNTFIAFFVGDLIERFSPASLPMVFYMAVKFWIGKCGNALFKLTGKDVFGFFA